MTDTLVYLNCKHPNFKSQVASILGMENSVITGFSLPISVHDLLLGKPGDSNYALANFLEETVPSTMKYVFSFSATDLQAGVNYGFQTTPIQLSATDSLIVPVLNTAFFEEMASVIDNFLISFHAEKSILAINLAPTGPGPNNAQFHIPGDYTKSQADVVSFWNNFNVTQDSVISGLVSYFNELSCQIDTNISLTCPIWQPYNNWLGLPDQKDRGKSYTTLETTLQSINRYVTVDQTLQAPDERGLIRKLANKHNYAAMLANMDVTDTQKITDSYNLALSYGAQWITLEYEQVPIIDSYLSSKFSGLS